MSVQPDRDERLDLEPGALDALAEAGRAAASGERVAEIARAVVDAAAGVAGIGLAVARLLEGDCLVTQAAASRATGLAAELEGSRIGTTGWPREETGLAAAPDDVARVAQAAGFRDVLVVPAVAAGELVGSLEVYGRERLEPAAAATARVAAAQLALAAYAYGARHGGRGVEDHALRLAGEALVAGTDADNAAAHVLRLAAELCGAATSMLWLRDESGELRQAGMIGTPLDGFDVAPPPGALLADAPGVETETAGGRTIATVRLGEPAVGALRLAFPFGRDPTADELERIRLFGARAAQALRAGGRAQSLAQELEQTRALLAVVGQASAQLSLVHTLETAVERISELVGADRLAIYLVDERRLVSAAERGLAGPHIRVAQALLALALGPYRARGLVVVEDTQTERGLASVADAVAEAGIEAVFALPLVTGDDVVGLLAVYPTRRRTPTPNDAALLSALAARLAVAVQNARLHEQATRLGRELEQALTAERAAARRLGALYEISRSFAQSLRLDVTLEAVAQTVAELLEVDAAVLRMPDPRREQLLPRAVHASDRHLVEPVRAILFRPQPLRGAEIERLFRTGEPVLLDPENAQALGASHALLVPFLEKGATAAVVPIATPSEVVASLTLVSLDPARPIRSETIETAVAIGAQAALAIENARLYQQQKDFADAMQRSLLPQVRPPVDGLDIGEVYAPSARVDVGGDLYDYIALDDGRLAVVLGDVTGHGIDAAADMAMAKFVFRSLAREHPEPSALLARANDVVVGEIAAGKFITMLYLLIDPRTGELACASAGHPPPRVVDPSGRVRTMEVGGLALGVESAIDYAQVREHLEPGGAVVLYTDGVTEARRDGDLYGTDRLDALLARRHALRAEDIAASVVQAARRFTGGELLDDCAVVVLKRTT